MSQFLENLKNKCIVFIENKKWTKPGKLLATAFQPLDDDSIEDFAQLIIELNKTNPVFFTSKVYSGFLWHARRRKLYEKLSKLEHFLFNMDCSFLYI